jgi:hypothetical protein
MKINLYNRTIIFSSFLTSLQFETNSWWWSYGGNMKLDRWWRSYWET